MHITQTFCLVSLLCLASITSAYASECTAKSGAHVVPLLELYTSEGCSSCPPADKWLSDLNISTSKVTPLAFHVDYWNYIGWQDRFSKAEYSNRQRELAANTVGFVYTPQFVLNGKDFRAWNNMRLAQAADTIHAIPATAQLQLDAVSLSTGEIALKATANVPDNAIARRADVFVALYENKLVSKVNAGENNGSELHHDYVVRELFGAYSMHALNAFSKQFNLSAAWQKRDAGAVMFVQDKQTGAILQSLALRFCQE